MPREITGARATIRGQGESLSPTEALTRMFRGKDSGIVGEEPAARSGTAAVQRTGEQDEQSWERKSRDSDRIAREK